MECGSGLKANRHEGEKKGAEGSKIHFVQLCWVFSIFYLLIIVVRINPQIVPMRRSTLSNC